MALKRIAKIKGKTPGKRPRGVRRFIMFSTLTRMIFLANLLGLIILIIGALTLNQFSSELIIAKVDNLHSQTRLISNLLGDQATGDGAMSNLDEAAARRILARIDMPELTRLRLYDRNGTLVADSDTLDNRVEVNLLEPIGPDNKNSAPNEKWWFRLQNWADARITSWSVFRKNREQKQRFLQRDIKAALLGDVIAGEQYENDELIVAVAMPVKRVADIQGVVVMETRDVDAILASQRRGLTPIILIAILASILSSTALSLFIAMPVRQLARAAEQVVRSSEKRDFIPDLSERGDEIGDLSVVLRNMTEGLYTRIDDIAKFAADVAHEIKNPLTSLRSASETLRGSKTKARRDKLIDIIEKDVARMDRLITDISKASRMDAALAKEQAEPIDLHKFLTDITEFYTQTRRETKIDVVLVNEKPAEPVIVRALENSFGQILRNLIDNALTFSPLKTETPDKPAPDKPAPDKPAPDKPASVRLSYELQNHDDTDKRVLVHVDDDGPGIPPDDLEAIFQRFYTQRPKGAEFGNHSGLGLAICRQIIAAHHGTLLASNRMDGLGTIIGARFTLSMPIQMPSRDRAKRK